jgi:endonuclease YncB( thermonuclease family)
MRSSAAAFLLVMLAAVAATPARPAGDSLIGTVTAVRAADLVVFNHGAGEYNLRLIGVAPPRTGPMADSARQFVSRMALGKVMRMRFEYRARNGDMLSRLFTTDTVAGIREVNVELLRAGLARRQANYDYKYGELSAAEAEARRAQRGLWAPARR